MSKPDRVYPLEVAGVVLRKPSWAAVERHRAQKAVADYAASVRQERVSQLERQRAVRLPRFNAIKEKRKALADQLESQ